MSRTFTYKRRRPDLTDLHKVVRDNFLTFQQQVEAGDSSLPSFVEKAFEKYLGCGHLANGFARVRCKSCESEQLVAFSCKARGICTSCDSKRMAEAAAHLVDEVLPQAAYRQWVFTLPYWLRFTVSNDHQLLGKILNIFVRTVECWYRADARARGVKDPRCAAFSVTQRFGDALRINPHYHVAFVDGVFYQDRFAGTVYERASPVTQSDVEHVLNMARRKVLRYLLKHGYVVGEASDDEGEHAHGSALAICTKASMLDRVAIGKRAGQLVARLYDEPPPPRPRGKRCADLEGFTLHANTQTAPRDRLGLERLCRYMCRPSFSVHRMEQLPNGDILFKLKTTWANGVIAKVFEPVDLMARMAALVVKPRVNLLRYHGQFAANAGWRKDICPGKKPAPEPCGDHGDGDENALSPSERSSWALMLKRCFQIDVLQCPCGARRELIATIPPGPVAKQILDHVGEPSQPPKFKRPRPPPTDHW